MLVCCQPPRLRWARLLVIALGLLVIVLLQSACGTTTVPPVRPAQTIAYDGDAQNAGILSLDTTGAVITPAKRAYYNALIEIYGDARWTRGGLPVFPVPKRADEGITPAGPNFRITRSALADLTVMHQWFKMGRTPQ